MSRLVSPKERGRTTIDIGNGSSPTEVRVHTTIIGLTVYYPLSDSIVLRYYDIPIPETDSLVASRRSTAFSGTGQLYNTHHLIWMRDCIRTTRR